MLDEKNSDNLKDRVNVHWDFYAPKYTKRVGYQLSNELKEAWENEINQVLENRKKLKVLDVGTGPGFLAMVFEDMGHHCTGVDYSQEMIKSAKHEAEKHGSETLFLRADAENLPFEDCSFDVVTNRHLIWTLTDPQKAVNEWFRVLKPGGQMMIFEGQWVSGHERTEQKIKNRIGQCLTKSYKKTHETFSIDLKPDYINFEKLKKELPMRSVTPKKIENLMQQAGLVEIRQQNIRKLIQEEIRNRPIGYQLTYNKNRFLVTGIKGEN